MSEVLQIVNPHANKTVAHIQLERARPSAESFFHTPARTRDFTIVAGDLWLEWFEQAELQLAFENSEPVPIMVTTLPNGSARGVIHFL